MTSLGMWDQTDNRTLPPSFLSCLLLLLLPIHSHFHSFPMCNTPVPFSTCVRVKSVCVIFSTVNASLLSRFAWKWILSKWCDTPDLYTFQRSFAVSVEFSLVNPLSHLEEVKSTLCVYLFCPPRMINSVRLSPSSVRLQCSLNDGTHSFSFSYTHTHTLYT